MKTNSISFSTEKFAAFKQHALASRSMGMNLAELKSVVDFSLRAVISAGSAAVNDVIFNEAFESYCTAKKIKLMTNHSAEKLIEKGHMNKSEISDMLAYANVSLPEHSIEL